MKALFVFSLLVISCLITGSAAGQETASSLGYSPDKQEQADKQEKVTHVKKRIRRRDLRKMKMRKPKKNSFAEQRRLERIARREEMKKHSRSALLHHGHEKGTKKRKPGEKIHCAECGIKH